MENGHLVVKSKQNIMFNYHQKIGNRHDIKAQKHNQILHIQNIMEKGQRKMEIEHHLTPFVHEFTVCLQHIYFFLMLRQRWRSICNV